MNAQRSTPSNFARHDFSNNPDEVLWADALMPHIGDKSPVTKPAGEYDENPAKPSSPPSPLPVSPYCAAAIFLRPVDREAAVSQRLSFVTAYALPSRTK